MQGMNKERLGSYVWKGKKVMNSEQNYVQTEDRMIDMSEQDLKSAYAHCKTMLYNKDGRNPGRHIVLELIEDQINKCGAELFLRYADKKGNSRLDLVRSINAVVNDPRNKEAFSVNTPTVELIFNDIPSDYKSVPLEEIIDGGLDQLGEFNKKHITRTLILRQGLWLTPDETQMLIDSGMNENQTTRMEEIRERLNIQEVERLSFNPRGFSFTEMRALLTIRPNKKYRDLATIQLETLRNKLLPLHEQSVRIHIDAWEERMRQIEEVASYNGITL